MISELPYGVKKGGDEGVIAKMAELVKTGVLSEISRLRDLVRQVGHAHRRRAEARRDPAGRPEQALQAHVAPDDVRLQRGRARRRRAEDAVAARARCATTSSSSATVVVRRSKYELRKAEERAHVLEGYLIALDNLDEVIALIRAAGRHRRRRATGLMKQFDLSEIQAQAILDLRLRALTALERKRVEDEHADLQRAHRRAPRDPRRRGARRWR